MSYKLKPIVVFLKFISNLLLLRNFGNSVFVFFYANNTKLNHFHFINGYVFMYFHILFIFRSEPNIGEAVKIIVNLPQNSHVALKCTAIELLAELTPWVDQNSQHIGKYIFVH